MRRRAALAAALAALCLGAGLPAAAGAETFVVTTFADMPAAAGACPAAHGFDCGLSTAVAQNEDDGGGDTIVLPAGHYTLTGGLMVSSPVTIEGQAGSVVIDAGGGTTIFNIFNASGAGVTLRHLTLTGAAAAPAILARNVDPLTLDDVDVSSNAEQLDGGAGGLVLNGSTATISGSIFAANSGGSAGAIELEGSSPSHLTITDSELRDNVALDPGSARGGALDVHAGTVDVSRSRFDLNRAESGGAIALVPFAAASVTVTDSTFDDNRATLGSGGAVYVEPPSAPVARSFTARSDTFVGDSAAGGGSAFGGALASISLGDSALAELDGGACASSGVSSLGHNVAADATCGLAGDGDREALDPQLAPLAANGGPTFTALPLAGSPLLDAADASACSATDQRGVARPQGAGCDIGAVELVPDPGSGGDGGGTTTTTPVPPPTTPVPPLVPAPPPPRPFPLPVPTATATAPAGVRISLLRVVPQHRRTATTLTWKATQRGKVRFTIESKRGGRWVATARFLLAGKAGANRHAFPANVLKQLPPGSYRLSAAATTHAAGTPAHASFHTAPLKRPRRG